MDLTVAAARRLLMGAASLGLLRALPGDRFALDDLGASMLGNPAIAAFVAHHDLLYADLSDPIGLLRGEAETRLSRFWPYASRRPDDGSEAVDAPGVGGEVYRRLQRPHVADAESRHRGDGATPIRSPGADGSSTSAAATAHSSRLWRNARRSSTSNCSTFPPSPPERAQSSRRSDCPTASRRPAATCLSDALPRGADVISLVRVLHDHDDELAACPARRRA